jgi:hypothetical protein
MNETRPLDVPPTPIIGAPLGLKLEKLIPTPPPSPQRIREFLNKSPISSRLSPMGKQ